MGGVILNSLTPQQIASANFLGWEVCQGQDEHEDFMIIHRISAYSGKRVFIVLDRAAKDIGPTPVRKNKKALKCSMKRRSKAIIPKGSLYAVGNSLFCRYRGVVAKFSSTDPEYRKVSNKDDIRDFILVYLAITIDETVRNPRRAYDVAAFYKGGMTVAERQYEIDQLHTESLAAVQDMRQRGLI